MQTGFGDIKETIKDGQIKDKMKEGFFSGFDKLKLVIFSHFNLIIIKLGRNVYW